MKNQVLKIIGKSAPILLLAGLMLFQVKIFYINSEQIGEIMFGVSFILIIVGIAGTLWWYVFLPRIFPKKQSS